MSAGIVAVTVIDADPAVVFDLELDVDVHTDSLAGSQETATTTTGRRRLGLGDEVTFRARHFGRHWQMTSGITEYDRPRRCLLPAGVGATRSAVRREGGCRR